MKTIAGAALLTLVALPAQAEGKNATFEYTLTISARYPHPAPRSGAARPSLAWVEGTAR
jgi:hypothetical protein